MPSKTPEPVVPEVRKGQGDMHISADVFRERLRERFHDPAFERTSAEIDKIIDIAWRAYQESHKSPRTRAAGERFADPEMQLSVQWLATRDAIAAAQREHDDPQAKSRVLVICGAARNDQTCPGEMSKTYRLCSTARGVLSSAAISRWTFSTSAGSPPSTAASSTRARRAYRLRCRCVTGRARAIRITGSARCRTGWARSIPGGWPLTL